MPLAGEARQPFWNRQEDFILFNKDCSQGKPFYWSPAHWGLTGAQLTCWKGNTNLQLYLSRRKKGSTQLQSPLEILSCIWKGETEAPVQFTVQRDWDPIMDCRMLPPIIKDLFITVSLTQYIMSIYQEKITRHSKRQKSRWEETEQELELESDMAGILELSDQKYKTIWLICQGIWWKKYTYSSRTDEWCKQRDGSSNKE